MRKIEVKILNPESVGQAEKMMVCAARLTQCGHKITCMDDFLELYERPYKKATVKNMAALPHPTIQKFTTINVVVVGASRRFLAQITRHQNEVKFMSASLQYSDYSGAGDFVIPYEILGSDEEVSYLRQSAEAMSNYQELIQSGIDNDSAGYSAPQGLRNILIMSATPYQWKYMIHQRTCRRNTLETRYVMLRIWEQLYAENPELFADCGPFCMNGRCEEGRMSCGNLIPGTMAVGDIIRNDFPKLCGETVIADETILQQKGVIIEDSVN
jgi:thymidylate synthase (FAD)